MRYSRWFWVKVLWLLWELCVLLYRVFRDSGISG